MSCEEAINLISARIDHELSADDRLRLEAHLAECADCRATAEAMQIQDAELVRTFAPRRQAAAAVAGRVAGQFTMQRRRAWWVLVIVSAAAGFLLAVLLFKPWQRMIQPEPREVANNSTKAPALTTVGALDIATGAVEIQPPGGTWQPMATGGRVPEGCRIRTGAGVRCEFAMDDRSQVRIDQNSELLLRSPRHIELARGQLWSSVAKRPDPFQVVMSDTTITALGTKFDVNRRPEQIELAVVEGSTKVVSAGMERVVPEGRVVQIRGGSATEVKFNPRDPRPAVEAATQWMDEVLMRKNADDPEVAARINDLMAHLGQEKLEVFGSNEIRALGDHCVVPLTRYIQSPRSGQDDFRRQEAARIIADVAQPWCTPYLIELLSDRDGEVRAAAADGLHRLTGTYLGRPLEYWRSGLHTDNEEAVRKWKQWWDEHKDRYPAVPQQPRTQPETKSL
jgi:ferric-dicitrate binding protein FerR (iron transport regulator)